MRTLCITLLATAACGTTGTSTTSGDLGGTPTDPTPMKTGPYRMVNTVDVTAEAVLPAQGEAIVATLREFSTNPARGLIDAADAAGVPALATIYDLLPDVLTDKFEGWLNDEIAKVKIAGHPLTDYTTELVGFVDLALTQFAVDSELTIADDGSTTHRLTALDLHPAGVPYTLPIHGLAGELLTQNPALEVGAGGALAFGEQHFGLNYGDYAWQGLEALSIARYGAGIRGLIGEAINCPQLASSMASKCALGVCVGHASTIEDLCNGGLDAVVNFAHAKMAELNVDALHFATGTATLVDDDGDGVDVRRRSLSPSSLESIRIAKHLS